MPSTQRSKHASVGYQERAAGFLVGDLVAPYGLADSWAGVVARVFPAIGMVDVEFPEGTQRLPVESVQNFTAMKEGRMPAPYTESGAVVPVHTRVASKSKSALYWTAPDRKHRATKSELDSARFSCPKCRDEEGNCVTLVNRILSRQEGKNYKILVCPKCTFAIQRSDIINCGE